VGNCFSIPPQPLPLDLKPDGTPKEPFELAPWVLRNIENNTTAYLWVALGGMILGIVLYLRRKRSVSPSEVPDQPTGSELPTRVSIVAFALIVIAGLFARYNWSDFNTTSHNVAAIGMFACLAVAAIINGITDRKSHPAYARWYLVIGVMMVLAGVGILWVFKESFGGYHVLWVEGSEIALFTLYWVLQTIHHWHDPVDASAA
jgi:hypothetical protein